MAEEGQVPVLVQLKGDRTVPKLIQAEFRRAKQRVTLEQIEDWLLADQLILLLDGVNEIPNDDLRRGLAQFREDNSTVPMIFTTRELAVGGDLGIGKRLEMKPLSEPQMREFVQKYLPEHGEQLLGQLRDRLREIAETPLFLKMLCDVFKQTREIPQNKGELFRQFDRNYERLKKDYAPVSKNFWEFKSEVLQHLAFSMIQADGQKPTDLWLTISKHRAESLLENWLHQRGVVDAPTKAKEWLKDLCNHHLLQDAAKPGEIEFHHQLFQEYYAAEHLLQKLPTLLEDESKFKRDYLNYLKWTEAVKLMLSLLAEKAQSTQLVKLALTVDLMLAVECVNSLKPEWHQDIRDLIRALEAPQGIINFALALTQSLPDNYDDYNHLVLKDEISDNTSEISLETLIQFLEDPDYHTREFAVIKLGEKYSDESVELLTKFIRKESFADLRVLAISTLSKAGDIKSICLAEEALDDEDRMVRLAAVQAIGVWRYEPLVPKLMEMLEDEDYDVRGGVAKALGKINCELAIQGLLSALSKADKDWLSADQFHKFQIENRFVVEALEGLKCASSDIQKTSLKCLKNIGSKSALRNSIEALQLVIESKPEQWISTVEAFAAIGSQQAVEVIIDLLDSELDDENLQLITIPEIVERQKLDYAIPSLSRLVYSSLVNESIANALASLNVVSVLPRLIQLWEKSGGMQYRWAIATIQNRCKYYNREIYQSALENEETGRGEREETKPIVQMIFNAPVHGVAGNVEGNQNIGTEDPKAE